jgi:sucrose-6-phosphate hydrolase
MLSAQTPSSSNDFRSIFHLTPICGWMNDPNGFSWFDGLYHLFYQHNPYASEWGPMHWAHAVSKDLVRWTHLPVALTPGDTYDCDGCFSGSAVTFGNRHALIYTGHVDPVPHATATRKEVQCLALGDGHVYKKLPENPIIDQRNLPPGDSIADFRDPKVWSENGEWHCICANRQANNLGQILLFRSKDLRHWRLIGPVLQNDGSLGEMWECPDIAIIEGRDTLIWSIMKKNQDGLSFQNPHSAVWSSGTFNRATGTFSSESIQELDHGPDFYAPQTLMAPDGRVLLVGWMQMWERSIPAHDLGKGWAGRMTILRELYWNNGNLAQRPVHELKNYRGPERKHHVHFRGSITLSGVEGHYLDMELDFCNWTGKTVGFKVFQGDTEETIVRWETENGYLTMDRSQGGVAIHSKAKSHPECQIYKMAINPCDGHLRFRVLLDRSALEIFADDGTAVMSATIYPQETSTGISFFCEDGTVNLDCRAWPLVLS